MLGQLTLGDFHLAALLAWIYLGMIMNCCCDHDNNHLQGLGTYLLLQGTAQSVLSWSCDLVPVVMAPSGSGSGGISPC